MDYDVEVTYQYTDVVSADSREEALELAKSRINTGDITRNDFDLKITGVYNS